MNKIILILNTCFFNFRNVPSDSEFEDEDGEIVLPQPVKAPGNVVDNTSSIVLHELGPRLTFQLIKIEEELMNGEVLYHDMIQKTNEEIEELRKDREKKKKIKEQRKKIQAENKKKNDQVKEERKRKIKSQTEDGIIPDFAINEESENEPDDDAEYYEQAVGEKPDEELFTKNIVSTRPFVPKSFKFAKKRKNETSKGKDSSRDRGVEPKKRKIDNKAKKKNFKKSK